ncbi:MAG: rhomboid family intramembrane serine protease [Candidatus Nanohaloarchaea archaeon]
MTELNQSYRFVALKLCAVFAAVYGFQVFTGFDPGFSASSSPWWKFITSVFGHSDMEHLFNNLFFIGLFGSIYERFTSSRVFLATFLLSALFANITAFLFYADSAIIGASGGGMGLMAALAVYRPRKIGLALGVPAPMWFVLVAYVFINVAGLSALTGVAYEAHLFGLLSGGVIGLWLRDQPYLEDSEDTEELENWRERIQRWEEKYML